MTASTSGVTSAGTLALADFNADGRLDAVRTSWSDGMTYVSLGNGNGTFASALAYTGMVGAAAVATGDINGDGKRDLLVENSYANSVTVRLGNANGTFQAGTGITISGGTSLTGIALADFNGDGRLDVFLSQAGGDVIVKSGTGTGTFGASLISSPGIDAYSFATGDFDGDGRADVAIGDTGDGTNGVALMFGSAAGGLSAPVYLTGDGQSHAAYESTTCVQVADLDGDGRLDLVTTTNLTTDGPRVNLTTRLGNGNGTFAAPTTKALDPSRIGEIREFTLVDVDGDGRKDFVGVDTLYGGFVVARSLGNGTFADPIVYPNDGSLASLAAGDITGDGRADIAALQFTASGTNIATLANRPVGTVAADLVVDKTAPTAVIVSVDGTAEADRPIVRISASDQNLAGQTIEILDGGAVVATAIFPKNSGSIDVAVPLAKAYSHSLAVRVTDAAGNATTSGAYAYDKTAPDITVFTPGGLTNSASVTMTGTVDTADAGRWVQLYENADFLGQGIVEADGSWSVSTTLLHQGYNLVVARVRDAAGNTAYSDGIYWEFDSIAPSVAITTSGGRLYQDTATISGTVGIADAGAAVGVYEGETLVGSGVTDKDGLWSCEVTLTSIGAHALVAKVIDTAGNVGTSNAVTLTRAENRAPTVPEWGTVAFAGQVLTDTTYGYSYTLLKWASDADGDPLSVVAVASEAGGTQSIAPAGFADIAGTYGTLHLGADGRFTYTSTTATLVGLAGHPTDAFSFTVSDGHGGTTTAQARFLLDRAPVPVVDRASVQGVLGTIVDVDAASGVLANDDDPDDGPSVLRVATLNGVALESREIFDENSMPAGWTARQATVTGTYGTLTIYEDGSYRYTLDSLPPSNAGSVHDLFEVRVRDQWLITPDYPGNTAVSTLDVEVLADTRARPTVALYRADRSTYDAIPGGVTIVDTAAAVAAALGFLSAATGVRSIELTDAGVPSFTLTRSQAASGATGLRKIAGPYDVKVLYPTDGSTRWDLLETTYGAGNVQLRTVATLGGALVYATDFYPDGTRRYTESTALNGSAYRVWYDTAGRQTEVVYPSGLTKTYTYDGSGGYLLRQTGITGQKWDTTEAVYGADGKLVHQTALLGTDLVYEKDYDTAGVTIHARFTAIYGTAYEAWYDDAGRRTKLITADGSTTLYAYDGAGLLAETVQTGITGRKWDRLDSTWGADGKLTGQVATLGGALVYDRTFVAGVLSHQVSTALNGSAWVADYDAAGRIASMSYPDGRVATYARNPDGSYEIETTGIVSTSHDTTQVFYGTNGKALSQVWSKAGVAIRVANWAADGSVVDNVALNGRSTAAAPFGGRSSIDLRAFAPTTTTLDFVEDASNSFGVLTLTEGSEQLALTLFGQYSASSFALAADGHGGVILARTSVPPMIVG